MYSESDLDAAVSAGAISAEAADGLRRYVAARRHAPAADEEHFRLITGFNDIFVVIASVILFLAVRWLAEMVVDWPGASYVATAAIAWGLAEYFSRRRRMALPSIVYLLVFVCSVIYAIAYAVRPDMVEFGPKELRPGMAMIVPAGIGGVVAAWLHWRRFQVPITVAAGIAAGLAAAVGLLFSLVPAALDYVLPIVLAAGIAVFAVAMWWDASDRARRTRRADVAFWLHLAAAPLIAHPMFAMLGLFEKGAGWREAMIALALYIVLAVVALAVDRRALLVSALGYVLYAMTALVRAIGMVEGLAVTALAISLALLLLSAFWHRMRNSVVRRLPASWQARLPAADRDGPPPLSLAG